MTLAFGHRHARADTCPGLVPRLELQSFTCSVKVVTAGFTFICYLVQVSIAFGTEFATEIRGLFCITFVCEFQFAFDS